MSWLLKTWCNYCRRHYCINQESSKSSSKAIQVELVLCIGASWGTPPWLNRISWRSQQLLIFIFTEQTALPAQVLNHSRPGFMAVDVRFWGWILTSCHGNTAITLKLAKAVSLSESLRKQISIGSELSQAERATYSTGTKLCTDVTITVGCTLAPCALCSFDCSSLVMREECFHFVYKYNCNIIVLFNCTKIIS